MAKVADEPVIIAPEDYIPELEEQVKYFMSTTPDLPRNEIKYKALTIPSFKSDEDQMEWELEQIRRCKAGWKTMCGKQYFYLNFCKIKNLGGGKIIPDFRVCDNEWFKLVEECQSGTGYGIVCVKRRRVGASWKEAADVLHDCLFNKHFNVGMNSKTERDSIELFKKVKFLYSSLPQFLRVRTSASNSKMFLEFAYYIKDENGNKIKRGNESSILVVAPTDSAYEGQMLNKWIADEAGKTSNLDTIWSMTEDCLMQETRRIGVPILFGTSGDVGNVGRALKDMWFNSDVYRLKRFFFAGWNGLICDEYGNDLKEEGIRYIIYERHRRRTLDAVKQNDFFQRYPLTVQEAFSQASTGGVGDIVKINAQRISLEENPPKFSKGYFKFDADGTVKFVPSNSGSVIIYEHPEHHLKAGYVAGCDPADHDDAYDEASDLSLYVIKKQDGLDPPRIVCEYTDRPKKLNDYYDQAIMTLLYYNGTRVLIERNRPRMISYFDDMGYKYLLQTTPQGIVRLVGGRANTIGLNMNNTTKDYLRGVITEYTDEYCELIPSKDLLQEFIEFGTRNTDKAMAFGIALIFLKEDKTVAKRSEKVTKILPRFSYKRINGKTIRVGG